MANDFNQRIIQEFRANGGRVGGPFEGARLLLLTTTGARTGAPHTTPLGYLPDGGERLLVIASAGGAPRHPDWYRNVLAEPRVTVEDGVFSYEARAVVLAGEERDRLFARAVEADPGWAEYQAKTDRVIPVVALHEVAGGPPEAGSFGEALRLLHDAFRGELARVRREIAGSGGTLAAQIRINCLTACQGLEVHHRMEDDGMFVGLAHGHPELAPTLARLREEHTRMAELLGALRATVSDAHAEPGAVLAETDRLIALLEAHLAYEEQELIPVLDGAAG